MTDRINGALVRDVGEFGLIAALEDCLPPAVRGNERVGLGIGDDAATWQPALGAVSVITTDTLIEDIHFRLDWTDWESLGHKMLAVNLSDIAAMGASPVLATVTLGLQGTERVANLTALYTGMGRLAEAHGVVVAGGDVVRGQGGMILSVTVVGEAPEGRVLTRSGAQPGDLIAVSGTLGASAAGLALLDDSVLAAASTTADLLIAAHLRPNPRLALGRVLVEQGATAAMDLSDGLYGDLPKILRASGISGEIQPDRVPALPAVRALFPDRWLELATTGGEDYELLFTIPEARWPALVDAATGIDATVTVIGHIREQNGSEPLLTLRDADGHRSSAPSGAFDHFSGRQND